MAGTMSLFLAATLAAAAPRTENVVVQTPLGPVRGLVKPTTMEFRGIRFGTAARWEPPVAVKPWGNTTVYNATADGAGCPQKCNLPPITCPTVTDEECLFLNIFTPKNATADSRLPVLFFIHGGAFHQGSIGGPLYDGTHYSERGLIVVTIQYRLGAFGFLNRGKKKSQITGNYGLMDQVLAMKWTHDNIAAFGGDPKQITISGQSAGSQSVATHLLQGAPAEPYFARAALFSCPFGIPLRKENQAESLASAFVRKSKCWNIGIEKEDDCLKQLETDEIVAAAVQAETDLKIELAHIVEIFEAWTPTRDTPEAPMNLLDAYGQHKIQDKEILIGSVHDEGENFIYEAFTTPISSMEEDLLLAFLKPDDLFKVKKFYGTPYPKDVRPQLVRVATDGLFRCPARHFMNITAGMAEHKTYVYHFDHVASFGDKFWGDETECLNYTCHGGDLPFIFKPDITPINGTYTPGELTMTQMIQDMLATFVEHGKPESNKAGDCPALVWPAFTADMSPQSMTFETPCAKVTIDPLDRQCDFWDSIGYHFM